MKKLAITSCILLCSIIIGLNIPSPAVAQDKSFDVSRLVICIDIKNREPVGISDIFTSTTEKVYCFLEATNIVADTTASFVWYFEQKQMAKIDLSLKKGNHWRTYSSKKLAKLKGTWKVEIQDEQGNIVKSINFKVE